MIVDVESFEIAYRDFRARGWVQIGGMSVSPAEVRLMMPAPTGTAVFLACGRDVVVEIPFEQAARVMTTSLTLPNMQNLIHLENVVWFNARDLVWAQSSRHPGHVDLNYRAGDGQIVTLLVKGVSLAAIHAALAAPVADPRVCTVEIHTAKDGRPYVVVPGKRTPTFIERSVAECWGWAPETPADSSPSETPADSSPSETPADSSPSEAPAETPAGGGEA